MISSYYHGVIVSGIKKQKKRSLEGTEKDVLGDKRPGICDEEKVQHIPIRRGRDLHPPNREL